MKEVNLFSPPYLPHEEYDTWVGKSVIKTLPKLLMRKGSSLKPHECEPLKEKGEIMVLYFYWRVNRFN